MHVNVKLRTSIGFFQGKAISIKYLVPGCRGFKFMGR